MRRLLLLSLLAACELKPGPAKQAEAPAAGSGLGSGSGSGSAVVATPPPAPPAPPPAAEAAAQPSEGCQRVAVHIAEVLISLADPAQKSVMEQDRTKLVRQAGLSCQKNGWSDEKIACFTTATTHEAFDACNRMPNKT